MNVEYTARKYEITPVIRKEIETGLNKIRKILGDRFETKVILAVEKRQHKAETQLAREKAAPLMEKGGKKKEAAVQAAYAELKANTAETESQRKHATAELEQWKVKKAAEIKQKYEAELSNIGVKKSTVCTSASSLVNR